MGTFNVAQRLAPGADRFQKVSEKFFDVLSVRLVERGGFLDDRLFAVGGVEAPALRPGQMENAFLAIKIDTDILALFMRIACEEAVLPSNGGAVGKALCRDLHIRPVAGLLFIRQDRRPADRTAAG